MGKNKNSQSFWSDAHKELTQYLQKEVSLMREILANMHEEELSLLTSDKTKWSQVMEDRSDLIVKLGSLRALRINQTKILTEITSQKMQKKPVSFEEILPLEQDSSSEILSLLDQLIALIERTNVQNARNDYLFYQTKNLNELPLHCSYPPPHLMSDAKRTPRIKTSVATYPPKK